MPLWSFGYHVEELTVSASLKLHVGWLCLWPTQQLATHHFISAITLQKEKRDQSLSQGKLSNSRVMSWVSGGLGDQGCTWTVPEAPDPLAPFPSHALLTPFSGLFIKNDRICKITSSWDSKSVFFLVWTLKDSLWLPGVLPWERF